ncbi:hypothetical protein DFH09DRAFT_1125428 [Mycena vulgaris]|nr:hypothetical protein DFH09DRAFT_1125428 [Mycena vulgaris]
MEQLPAENSPEIPTRDSMIVIRAENKIFPVSRAILAARSIVFRDMLAFPQPTSEQIDGSPVVRVHDSARDAEVFLRAIYDSSDFMPAPAPVDLWAVLSILRLFNKYDIQYLYRRALEHLTKDGWYQPAYDEVGALWLLPYVNYCVSTYYIVQLLSFLKGETEQIVRKNSRCACAYPPRNDRGKPLPRHARPVRDCYSLERRPRHASIDFLDDIHAGRALNPRWEWEDDELESLTTEGMCDICYELAKARHDSAAVAFWDTLPSIFGLPPWTELRAMMQATMGEEEDMAD